MTVSALYEDNGDVEGNTFAFWTMLSNNRGTRESVESQREKIRFWKETLSDKDSLNRSKHNFREKYAEYDRERGGVKGGRRETIRGIG